MGITGIICEFNPLHNGHQLLVQRAKSLFPNNDIALIMSGNVVQRGELALFDKATRANWAIQAGTDIVFEFPAVYSNSYAMHFARGGISLLSQIPAVTDLVFGSECGDVDFLSGLVKSYDISNSVKASERNDIIEDGDISNSTKASERNDIIEDSDIKNLKFKGTLHAFLNSGLSYPRALACTYESITAKHFDEDVDFTSNETVKKLTDNDVDSTEFLLPNNILGIEYIRALKFFKSKITPHTVPREKNTQTLMSASEIRKLILKLDEQTADTPDYFSLLKSYVPTFVFEDLSCRTRQNVANDDLFKLLKSKILTSQAPLAKIAEVTEGIENRFIKGIEFANSYQEYIHYIKTKRYTMAKIKRILISILLDKTKALDNSSFENIDYIKVLAVNSYKKSLLGLNSSLKFITKTSDFSNLNGKSAEFLRMDKMADDLFNICNQKTVTTIYTHKMQIVD